MHRNRNVSDFFFISTIQCMVESSLAKQHFVSVPLSIQPALSILIVLWMICFLILTLYLLQLRPIDEIQLNFINTQSVVLTYVMLLNNNFKSFMTLFIQLLLIFKVEILILIRIVLVLSMVRLNMVLINVPF